MPVAKGVEYPQEAFVELSHGDGHAQGSERQEDLWVAYTDVAVGPGHPFYVRLNELLDRRLRPLREAVCKVLCQEMGRFLG